MFTVDGGRSTPQGPEDRPPGAAGIEPGKRNDLLKQHNAIQKKLTELPKREAEVYWVNFENELTDLAFKT